MKLENLKNKKICLLGLGLENLSLAKYLARRGIAVSVLDKRGSKELGDRYKAIKKIKANFYGGLAYLDKLSNFDIIFKSPGFVGSPRTKKDLPALPTGQAGGRQGAIITSAMKLFFDLCPAKIIAITGTKGKGTVASLCHHVLIHSNKKAWLAGNIGKAPFDFIDKLKPNHFIVLELSSFQLIDFKNWPHFAKATRGKPHIAVVTNLFPEHLSPADPINPIFHKSLKEYYNAKANIFLNQKKSDWLVVNKNSHHPENLLKKSKAKIVYFEAVDKLPDNPNLLGKHNRENIAAANAIAAILKIPKNFFYQSVSSFRGLEHHLKLVKEINGIKFYDDSASTMPMATLAAARAFDKDIILIVGGVNKGYDLKNFAKQLSQLWQPIAVVLIGQVAKELEYYLLKQKTAFAVYRTDGRINKIVKDVLRLASKLPSKIPVVFSPGFASFDMFKNSKDKGEKFKEAVLALR